jgi:hypothetical protein
MAEAMLAPASFQTQEMEAAMSSYRAGMTGRHHACERNAGMQAFVPRRGIVKSCWCEGVRNHLFPGVLRALTKSCAAP